MITAPRKTRYSRPLDEPCPPNALWQGFLLKSSTGRAQQLIVVLIIILGTTSCQGDLQRTPVSLQNDTVSSFRDLPCDTCDPIDQDSLSNGGFLQVDNNNVPHIVYRTSADSQRPGLHYAFRKGAGWSDEIVDANSKVGSFASIALDASNNPHILYADATDALHEKLKYAYKDDSGWHCEVIFNDHTGIRGSLALDAKGKPHIAYYGTEDLNHESPSVSKLKYAFRDTTGWRVTTVDDVGEVYFIANGPSLVLDRMDHPHIAYHNTNNQLKYASFDGSIWSTSIIHVGTPEVPLGQDVFLASDSNDSPHVVYATQVVRVTGPTASKHAVLYHAYITESGDWLSEVVKEDFVIEHPVLAIDSFNRAHVVYSSFTSCGRLCGNSQLEYSIKSESSWSHHTLATNSDISTAGTMVGDIAVSKTGTLGIVYVEYQRLNYLVQ